MPAPSRRERDAERRETVERYHRLKDEEEDYERAMSSATSSDDRQTLMDNVTAYRQRHREKDVERGKQPRGGGVMMEQIMWARWADVMIDHELAAREAYTAIVDGNTEALIDELRQSLVAITAAAFTVEALYEDIRYLIPEQHGNAADRITNGLCVAFGLDHADADRLSRDLNWLFARRNEVAHAYSEAEIPTVHPSGITTGAELSRFNAVESGKAADIALWVLKLAETAPNPRNRWITRWAKERLAYHERAVNPLRAGRARSFPERVSPADD
jgi:hypothetical protein